MKNKLFFQVCALLSMLLSGNTLAQSISGNMNSGESTLGYGSVDVYKNGVLVANTVTDRNGNFKIALDTGTYQCVYNYAGFEPLKKEVRVLSDEKSDGVMKKDKMRAEVRAFKASAPAFSSDSEGIKSSLGYSTSGGIAFFSSPPSGIAYDKIDGLGTGSRSSGTAGALTAGEINDFAKWKLWNDVSMESLTIYKNKWNLAPAGRYSVQVTNENGIPLSDAMVKLLVANKVVYITRTDNTGKAELWLTIKNEKPQVNGEINAEVEYNGKIKKIERLKTAENGPNCLKVDFACKEEVENVDIAFVFDATGSMGDELSFLQAEMVEIIYQSKKISDKLNFRFANVFYRDTMATEEYATRIFPFNRVLTEATAFINQQVANGGGDYPEAVELGLEDAINKLEWSKSARTRILFLILDAPPHQDKARLDKIEKLTRQAAEKGIRIVPIGASGIDKSTEYLLRAMALATNGTYTFLTNHSGIGNSHIEPTTDKYDVNKLQDLLIRIIKSYTYKAECDQELPEILTEMPDSLVQYPAPNPKDSIKDSTNVQPKEPLQISWSYYPNPTTGIVNVKVDRDVPVLYLTDLSGKLIQTIENIEKDRIYQFDLTNYSTGIYLIRYQTGNEWVSGKVMLTRL